jgi:FG-GAP-like repeat
MRGGENTGAPGVHAVLIAGHGPATALPPAVPPSGPLRAPAFLAALLLFAALPAAAATGRELALSRVSLALPGAPAVVIPADLDGDGRGDLVVVVATTGWEDIGVEERAQMDAVEGLVEVLTVVPALLDRRQVRFYRGVAGGGFALAGEPLELPPSVLSLAAGPPGLPVVALTDEGLSALRLGEGDALRLEPLLADPPVLAGSGLFLPDLGLTPDLDGDGRGDLLLPVPDGAAVYLTGASGLASKATSRVALPGDERLPGDARHYRTGPVRHYPLPAVFDADGDGLPDLLVRNHERGWNAFFLLRGLGGGRFAPPVKPLGERARNAKPEVVFFGDLDGDGRAELVTAEEEKGEEGSLRKELAAARRPRFRYRIHRLTPELGMAPAPARELEVEGYAFGGDEGIRLPGGFQDLNGDGRQDLVTLTLDFSLLEALKALTFRRLSVGLDFHVWCQQSDGSFRPVPGLDLSGVFHLKLDDLRPGQLSLFAGDFDGDGRADFVQMGRGRRVTIHRGREDCSYPAEPDLTIELEEPPQDLALVQVRDLDGDGRADLMVTQAQSPGESGETAPVRLDLYLSGGGR